MDRARAPRINPRTESDNSARELNHVSVMMGPVPAGWRLREAVHIDVSAVIV